MCYLCEPLSIAVRATTYPPTQQPCAISGAVLHCVLISIHTMRNYQLMVQLPNGELVDTSWSPRSYRAASALARIYTRNFPNRSYWLRVCD